METFGNHLRRVRRVLLILLGITVGLVLLGVIGLVLRPVREAALRHGLQQVSTALPGELHIQQSRWSSLELLELDGLAWTQGGDTLAAVNYLRLEPDLRALIHRDIHLRLLHLEGVRAELPHILDALPPSEQGSASNEVDDTSASFPRTGSFLGLPSIGLDQLELDLVRLSLPDASQLRGQLRLHVEARRNQAPRLEGKVELSHGTRPPIVLEAGSLDAQNWGLQLRAEGSSPVLDLKLSRARSLVEDSEWARAELEFVMPSPSAAASFPYLDSLVLAVPELSGGSIRIEGPFSIQNDSPELMMDLALSQWPVLRNAQGQLSWYEGHGEIQLEIIEAGGVTGILRVKGPTPSYEGTLDLKIQNGLDLTPFVDSDTFPEDLRAHLSVELSYPLNTGGFLAKTVITASTPSKGFDEATLELDAWGTLESPSGELRLRSRSGDLSLDWKARAQYADSLFAQLSPIRVQVDSLRQLEPPAAPAVDETSRVVWDPATKETRVDGLRVEGDAGQARVDLLWSDIQPRYLNLDWKWATPPKILGILVESFADEDSLGEAMWVEGGEYYLRLEAQERAAHDERFELAMEARVPAPWHVLPQLPSEMRSRGMPLALHGAASGGIDSLHLTLNADANDWLHRFNLQVRHAGSHSILDSLQLELEGLMLTAHGERDDGELSGEADVALHNDLLLREFLGNVLPQVSSRVSAHVEFSGSADSLDADLVLGADLQSIDARVDTLGVLGHVRGSKLESAKIWAKGLKYQRWQIETFGLQWQGEGRTLLPGVAALELRAPDLEFLQIARVGRDSIWTVEVDTLGLRLGDQDIRSEHPFRFLAALDASSLWLSDLELSGTLGQASADLRYGPGLTRGTAELHLQLPEAPVALGVPEGAWPSEFDLSLEVDELRLSAMMGAKGMGLGSRRDLQFELEARSSADSLYFELDLRGPERVMAEGRAFFPLGYVSAGPRWEPRNGQPTLVLSIDDLPLPSRLGGRSALDDYFLGRGQEQAPQLDASIDVQQVDGELHGALQARVGFEQIPELSQDLLEIAAVWTRPEDPPLELHGDLDLDRLMNEARDELDTSGVGLRLEWKSKGEPRLWLGAFSPLLWNAEKGRLDWENKDLLIEMRSAEIQIEDFNRFLPDRIRVQGSLAANFSATGRPQEMQFDGSLTGRGLTFADPGRAEVSADLDFQLSGTSQAPVIRGKLVLDQGTVRLPENRKSFHDASGRSMLWEAAAQSAALDSTTAPIFGPTVSAAASDTADARLRLPQATDMSVEVSIPRNFWIRGRGLEVRLIGELEITQEGGKPIVSGHLETIDGRFSFMSKTFRARRGRIDFFGDPTDPSLDLELNVRVADVEIFVNIRGTAQLPELELYSDPYMEEADIMSYLLFGGPTGSLDQAGSDLLNQQAINALEGFAIPALEGGVGSDLGLSMIALTANEDADKGMNIMVGRYITPEILLRYEMSLEDSQDYTVNLEYWINQRLSLQTYFSQARESGIELNWSKEY